MFCVVGLKRKSPNTELVPSGWVIADGLDNLKRTLIDLGETALSEKISSILDSGAAAKSHFLIDERRNMWLLAF